MVELWLKIMQVGYLVLKAHSRNHVALTQKTLPTPILCHAKRDIL